MCRQETGGAADARAGSHSMTLQAAASPPDDAPCPTTDLQQLPQAEVAPSAACVEPVAEHAASFTGAAAVNLAPLVSGPVGGAFSFMCSLRADSLGSWARVFDFSLNADEDSVTAGAIESTCDLHFTVFQGDKPVSLRVDGFFEPRVEFTMLCTVSASGHMKVFKNGELVGEKKEGAAPLPLVRPHMIVGSHFLFDSQELDGVISGVKLWDREVSWPGRGIEGAPPAPEVAADLDGEPAVPAAPSEGGEEDLMPLDQEAAPSPTSKLHSRTGSLEQSAAEVSWLIAEKVEASTLSKLGEALFCERGATVASFETSSESDASYASM